MIEKIENGDFALVPIPAGAVEKTTPGAKRVLSGMVVETLALGKSARASARRPLRVVAVDDSPEILDIYAEIIEMFFDKATILKFLDGEAAWQELQRTEPDLLITDLSRPEPSGVALLNLLAERNAKYPIFVISGSLAANQGALDLLAARLTLTLMPKPFTPSEVLKEMCMRFGPSVDPELLRYFRNKQQ